MTNDIPVTHEYLCSMMKIGDERRRIHVIGRTAQGHSTVAAGKRSDEAATANELAVRGADVTTRFPWLNRRRISAMNDDCGWIIARLLEISTTAEDKDYGPPPVEEHCGCNCATLAPAAPSECLRYGGGWTNYDDIVQATRVLRACSWKISFADRTFLVRYLTNQ